MLKQKNPVVVLLLSIVTCGIYGLVWYWQTMDALDKEGQSSIGGLQPIVQFILLFFYVGSILFALNADANINAIRAKRGLPAQDNKVIWLVFSIICPVVTMILVQIAINDIADIKE